MRPVWETDRRLTLESLWIMATGVRMFRRSHILALRSSEPETTLGIAKEERVLDKRF